jgi:signal peptidase
MTQAEGAALENALPRPAGRSPLRVVRSVLAWLAILLIAATVALLVFVALAPRLLGWHFVIVAGGSMEPTIHLGSVAILEDAKGADVGVGDIVMFPWPADGHTTTHRIVDISEDGTLVRTKGDANSSEDPDPVPRDTIRAKFLFSVPHAGDVVNWVKSPRGYLVIILVPGIAIIAFELLSIVRSLRRRNEPAAGSAPATTTAVTATVAPEAPPPAVAARSPEPGSVSVRPPALRAKPQRRPGA